MLLARQLPDQRTQEAAARASDASRESAHLKAPLAMLLAWLPLSACCSEAPSPPPNVILITVDTLRADRTTPYGYARDTSPALAKMAEEGTLFERAYAMSSWTLPSMSMLLSGSIKPLADPTILPGHGSIAESFQGAGYRTCGVAGNSLLDAEYGYDRGLDHYALAETEEAFHWTAKSVFDRGLGWLRETDPVGDEVAPRPYFLWLHPVDPHAPYAPTDGNQFPDPIPGDTSRERSAAALAAAVPTASAAIGSGSDAPLALDDEAWERIQTQRDYYDSEVLQFDAQVGRLFKVLGERGELENTIVIVTSDHGEGLWQRATNADQPMAARNKVFPWLYHDHGAQVFEEQVRVPLLFFGPGVPRGHRVTEPVDHVDVVPSVLALADIAVTRSYPGAPLFVDGSAVVPSKDPIVAICSRVTSITEDGRWRLHVPREHRLKKEGVRRELFDLEADPFEMRPIVDEEKTADLAAKLVAWERRHAPEGLRAGDIALDQQLFLKLHQLGYGGEAEHVKKFVESLEEKQRAAEPQPEGAPEAGPSAPELEASGG